MKHVRMLGLLVMAAASLMAFASSASATPILTSEPGVDYTSTIHATLESGSTAVLKAGIEDTCSESTVHGTVTTNNTEHAAGALSALPTGLSFGGCTRHTTVVKAGSLTIDDQGTVFTIGSRVRVQVTGLATCYYGAETGAVSIGDLTEGTPATIDINTTELQRLSESNTFWCAKNGAWTGSYVVTTPKTLLIT